jgi:glycosyltransferase involved in cell wall biosynthesis
MKICISTDAWKPIWGGGQEHILQTSKRLIEKYGFQIDIVAPNLLPKTTDNLPNLHRVGPSFAFPSLLGRTAYLISLLFWEITHSYDIYHSHANDVVLFPILKLLKPKSKFMYTVHGKGNELLNGGLLNVFRIPQIVQRILIDFFPFDALFTAAKSSATQAIVIGNGVNVEDFDRVASRKSSAKFRIVWVGRENDPVKGVKFLKIAFEILKKKYSNFELNLVSGKPHVQVIRELKNSNLFVLSSLSEGLPLAILEAMAARLPIVATDVGDCRELIEKSEAGIIVKPGNAEALAEAIEAVYKNPGSMGQKGYAFVRKNYSWEKVADKIYAQYAKKIS